MESSACLTATYQLRQDMVLERRSGFDDISSEALALATRAEKRARTREYMGFARHFLAWCMSKQAKLLSVSGSTSYLSPGRRDDLDFFVVSQKDSLWILLAKSLILARVFRLLYPSSPRLCFSYLMDEEFARREFVSPKDPLSARDALTALVVYGSDFHTRLLKKNVWISNYYPRLFEQKTRAVASAESEATGLHTSTGRSFLNLFTFFVLGNYIRFKSALLNRQLLRQRKISAIFTVKMGSDHLVFESNRYVHLRRMYSNLPATTTPQHAPTPRQGR